MSTINGTSGKDELIGTPDDDLINGLADDDALSGLSVFDLTVANTNQVPTVPNPIGNQGATEDQTFNFTVPANTFADTDPGDTLIYAASRPDGSAFPLWLSFNPSTRTFSGAPANGDVGTLSVRVTVTDTQGASASDVFDIVVGNVNDGPGQVAPLPAVQHAMVGSLFSYTVPDGTFVDVDSGDTLTYTATLGGGMPLPAWLAFVPLTGTLSGTPLGGDTGTLSVVMGVVDSGGLPAGSSFQLVVAQAAGTSIINGTPGNDTLSGGASHDTISGFGGDDNLSGLDGNDTLDGGPGGDTLAGGRGDDIYVVDAATDAITEFNLQGFDTVLSSVTYSLAALPFVEHLTLTGANPINATGNSTFNVIIGNSADNVIDGGSSLDVMAGGLGNDSYFVDFVDLVMEKAGEGIDTVFSSPSSFSLPLNLENLTLIGTTDSHGLGNDADNVITGNSGNNVLNGLGGIDTLIGGLGNDHYVVDSTTDIIIENPGGGGFDRLQSSVSYSIANLPNIEGVLLFGNGTDAIDATGNSGDNVLQGDAAANVLAGGAGDDSYQLVGPEDTIVELSGGGSDTLFTQFTYTLGAELERLTLTGNSSINGTGNALDNVLTGNSAANVLAGGSGNDTYVLNAPAGTDTIIENPGEGMDTVQADFTFSIASLPNLENLTLTGFFPINATGNAGNNVLTGNTSSNVLNGGDGIDTLIGGPGNDTYFVDNAGDVVTENPNEGTDTVQSSISYTLTANVENLALTGSANINGTGNTLANVVTGNTGNNILDGGAGSDALLGGPGDDTYAVDQTNDVVTENVNEGTDGVVSSATYTLSANVELLTLTGSANIGGTGNAVANVITGNVGNNTLDGRAGADTMTGGLGDDTYVVDDAADVLIENAGEGTDTVQTAFTHILGAAFENLTLTGSANVDGTGNGLHNVLIGNDASSSGEGKNTLIGGAGDDVLDGRTGFDTLQGGSGDDTYVIDDSMGGPTSLFFRSKPESFVGAGHTYSFNTDTGVILTPTLGDSNQDSLIDFVRFQYFDTGTPGEHSFTVEFSTSGLGTNIAPGTYLDALSSFPVSPGHPSLDISGDGRASPGEAGSFTIANAVFDYSGATPVLLSFSASFEQHIGSVDNPVLIGTVNYNYTPAGPVVHDSVIENANEGIDTVLSSFTYALGGDVENLTLTNARNVDGIGNELNNVITGNSGNNVLVGGSGEDLLYGDSGDDTLDGGPGSDTLRGGAHNDRYLVNESISDSVIENPGEGDDTVNSSVAYALPANVEILTLTGSSDLSGTGNESANVLTGNAGGNVLLGYGGNDRLLGGSGNDLLDGGADLDTLRGGTGDDTYVLNDVVILGGSTSLTMHSDPGEFVGQGKDYSFDTSTGSFFTGVFDRDQDGQIDAVRINYVETPFPPGHFFSLEFATTQLGSNLTPGVYFEAERAAFASPGHPGLQVAGNGSASNTLTGSFTVHAADFDYSGTTPLLRSFSVSFEQHDGGSSIFPALFGTLNYNIAPVGSTVSDSVIENPNEGTDTVLSSVAHTLPANVENLTLTGSGNIDGIGNALANAITGNAGNNTLSGGSGNDTYILNVGFGQDFIIDNDATSGNVDTIVFGNGMTSGAVIVEPVGINDHDIRLSFIGSADAVIMQGWLASDDSKVERLEFADDVVWGVQNILNRITFHTQNHAPTLATPLADQAATEDAAFSFTVPADAFADVDAGDILSFTATRANGDPLPGWLAFDAATRTFAGTPASADAGTLEVRVTATDTANASAADVFQLAVTGNEDDHNHDKRRKGNEGVGNGADPPPPGHDHNQNDGSGTGPGNPGSRQLTNDRDRGRVRTADRDSYGSNSDSGTRGESIEELVQAYLERKPDYDFEALAWEPQRSPRSEEVLNPLETARRWAQMHRYIDALGEADDEEARYGALTARRGFFGQDAAYAGAGGIFGHAGSTGAAHAIANLRTLQGLEEGFTRLRT